MSPTRRGNMHSVPLNWPCATRITIHTYYIVVTTVSASRRGVRAPFGWIDTTCNQFLPYSPPPRSVWLIPFGFPLKANSGKSLLDFPSHPFWIFSLDGKPLVGFPFYATYNPFWTILLVAFNLIEHSWTCCHCNHSPLFYLEIPFWIFHESCSCQNMNSQSQSPNDLDSGNMPLIAILLVPFVGWAFSYQPS